jgi:hypothetical protein
LKDNEEIRPLSANRNTIKAMEQRGLISPGKGRDPLTIVWRLKKSSLRLARYASRPLTIASNPNPTERIETPLLFVGCPNAPKIRPPA